MKDAAIEAIRSCHHVPGDTLAANRNRIAARGANGVDRDTSKDRLEAAAGALLPTGAQA
ncbi:hypothetical protein GCM10027199_83530 [Amycolatopsis magusensis]